MNKKLLKILIFLFTFVALMLNATFSSATSESDSEKRINVSGIVCNPVFGEQTEIQAQTFLSSSVSEYSEQEYSDDIEDIITDIREGMENRDESITVYLYIELDDEIETSQDVDVGWNDVINILLEEVFKETNVATQGDYLRYNWSQCAYMISWATTGDVYYFDITFDFTYYTTKEQEDELTLEINKLIESFEFDANTTDREKVDTIYDYITSNIVYDYENLESTTYQLHFTAYAALMHKTAVCQGYAVLFYRLAETCGIDARVITGYSSDATDIGHAWNIVNLGDFYYYVDATWDAELIEYEYYLKGSNDFLWHINDDKFNSNEFTSVYPISPIRIRFRDRSNF